MSHIIWVFKIYCKTCFKRPLKRKTKIGFQDIQSLNSVEYSAVLLTYIKLTYDFKTFVMSIFEWPLKTDFSKILYIL